MEPPHTPRTPRMPGLQTPESLHFLGAHPFPKPGRFSNLVHCSQLRCSLPGRVSPGRPHPLPQLLHYPRCFLRGSQGYAPAPSRLTLCDPMDGSTPGSSVHGVFQATILEWAAMPCPPLGHLLGPGIKLTSPALQVDSRPLH